MSVVEWGPAHLTVTSPPCGGGVVVEVSPPRTAQRSERPLSASTAVGPFLAAPLAREALAPADGQNPPSLINHLLHSVGLAKCDDGYWTPTTAAGEIGLLEAFHRKTAQRASTAVSGRAVHATVAADGLDTFVLVYGRPVEELRRNFSNHRGERVDLSQDVFQLSSAAQALRDIDNLRDDAAVSGRDVKAGLRTALPKMQRDRFFLVAYRDYSLFATTTFPSLTKRERLGSPRFVEMHFAVRVGQNAGVFVPISAAQFLNGWELLSAEHIGLAAAAAAAGSRGPEESIERWALNTDQFRSLGPLPPDLLTAAASESSTMEGGAAHSLPSVWYRPGQPEPHRWDMSPSALQFRLQRYLERQYLATGRVVVKGAIIVGGVLLIQRALQARRGANHPETLRGARRRGASDTRLVHEAFMDAVFDASPASFLRYLAGAS